MTINPKHSTTKCHRAVSIVKTAVCLFHAWGLWSESSEVEGLPHRPLEDFVEEKVLGRGLEGGAGGQGGRGHGLRRLGSSSHFFKTVFYVYGVLPACMSAHHVYAVLAEAKRGHGCPGVRLRDSW